MKHVFIILLYIHASLAGLSGQDIKVTAAFDSSRIYIGDQIKFTVTVEKPATYPLSIPVLRDTLMKNIEILNGPVTDTSILNNGRIRIIEKYLVTSFDSGFYQVPPVYAEARNESGIKRFFSDYAFLEVMRVKIAPPDKTSKICDIIKPYRAPLTIGEILPWVLLFLFASAVIWVLIRYFRKLKTRQTGEIPVSNPIPAHVIAFRELEKLKDEKLWQKGEIKKYHTRLTEILRQYLENRFKVFSLELTTADTLAELTKTGFRDDESYSKLRTVLTGADLVKFAKHKPEPSENETNFDYAWSFVRYTKSEDQLADEPAGSQHKKEEGV